MPVSRPLAVSPLRSALADSWQEASPYAVHGTDDGGDEGTRTPDPLLAKEVLSQLSYIPIGGHSRADG